MASYFQDALNASEQEVIAKDKKVGEMEDGQSHKVEHVGWMSLSLMQDDDYS